MHYNQKQREPRPNFFHEDTLKSIGIGLGIVAVLILGTMLGCWMAENAQRENMKEQLFEFAFFETGKQDSIAQAKRNEEWSARSKAEGVKYAKRFAATASQCDQRATTSVIKDLEGLDPAHWLAGCLSAASDQVPS